MGVQHLRSPVVRIAATLGRRKASYELKGMPRMRHTKETMGMVKTI